MKRISASPIVFLFISLIILNTSCKPNLDFEEFSAGMSQTFAKKDSTTKKVMRNVPANVYAIYKGNGFAPVWMDENGGIKQAEKLIEQLEVLPEEGLPASRYNVASLKEQLDLIKKNKTKKDINAVITWDKLMTTTYVTAANDLLYGLLDPDDVDDMWFHDNDSAVQWAEIAINKDLPELDVYRSKLPTYAALVARKKNNNDTAGRMIDVNLERLRWLPQEFEEKHILVVVPQMEMQVREDNKTTLQMKAVVGRTDRETPSLNADMVNIVFNPSWGVPPGILKKDVIPGLLAKGEGYLDKKDLKVYDRKGNEVDASAINGENYKGYVFRQPPSEKNALGQIKFNMPNPWDIYMHDTPSKGDFSKDERYKSSGCVRLEQPRILAEYILKKMYKGNDSIEIDGLINESETKYIKLKEALPVHMIYITAYAPSGTELQYFKDIYGKDEQLATLLNQVK